MSEKVGADVPFCIQGGTMLAMDIGGVLAPLPDVREDYYVLVKPHQDVSTKEAYGAFDKADYVRHLDTSGILRAMVKQDTELMYRKVGNVFEQFIEVAERVSIKSVMRENNAICHCMSGSGPTIYGAFEQEADAAACEAQLKAAGFEEVFLCQPKTCGVEIVEK